MTETYPVCVRGVHRGSTHQAVVRSIGYRLLSKAVMSDVDTDLCIGRNGFALNTIIVTFPVTEDTLPVVDLTDIDIMNLHKEWPRIPILYNMSEKGGPVPAR